MVTSEKKADIEKVKVRMNAMRYALACGVICTSLANTTNQEPFKILLEPKWVNLDTNPERAKEFGGKWILAGSITLKKRSPEVLFLDKMKLTWEGEKIEKLIGSLYEKNDMMEFLPIEKYLLSDSMWKSSTQQMILHFHRPLTLGAINTLYLVLTVPEELENILKKGKFTLEHVNLPVQYRHHVKGQELSIALSDLHPQESA